MADHAVTPEELGKLVTEVHQRSDMLKSAAERMRHDAAAASLDGAELNALAEEFRKEWDDGVSELEGSVDALLKVLAEISGNPTEPETGSIWIPRQTTGA